MSSLSFTSPPLPLLPPFASHSHLNSCQEGSHPHLSTQNGNWQVTGTFWGQTVISLKSYGIQPCYPHSFEMLYFSALSNTALTSLLCLGPSLPLTLCPVTPLEPLHRLSFPLTPNSKPFRSSLF